MISSIYHVKDLQSREQSRVSCMHCGQHNTFRTLQDIHCQCLDEPAL